jgi:hypothetical protein
MTRIVLVVRILEEWNPGTLIAGYEPSAEVVGF